MVDASTRQRLVRRAGEVDWYHTVDLGDGVVTAGYYDHRPHLHHYGFPDDLTGMRVLDIGAASGFFLFEFERRGADVVATDLSDWFDHDFGPLYRPGKTSEALSQFLNDPFELAKALRGSKVERKLIRIYDISPETVGRFELVFCGSVLLHLSDPARALWNIASVTEQKAIIATAIEARDPHLPSATFIGHRTGDTWWQPTRACLELMAVAAGFVGIDWIGEFYLNSRTGAPGFLHGVLHAYTVEEQWTPTTVHRDEILSDNGTPADR